MTRGRKRPTRPPPQRPPALRVVLGLILAVGLAIVTWLTYGQRGIDTAPDVQLATQPPNVLLIVVDTLRVDRLGCYGSGLGASPDIDALARDSVRFEQAYAHSPWTLPSIASIFTALLPPVHGAGGVFPTFQALRPEARTVAECFRDAGYATAAVINVEFLTASVGMTQGFDHVDFASFGNVGSRRAGPTTDAALAWLRQRREKPFFLFVHFFDPHLVYDPPPEFRRRFAAPRDRETSDWVFGTIEQMVAYRQGELTLDAETVGRLEKLHDGEVAYTDQQVGRLLAALDEMEATDSTIVVLTADHGEEFHDHGGFEHGHTVYNELVHVPLIIRLAGPLAPAVIPDTVRHIDLAPTLCELADVPADPAFSGRSLVELLAGRDSSSRPVVFEGNLWGPPYWGWLHDGYKLIRTPAGRPELYNVRDDPRELVNLSESEPARVQALLANLQLTIRELRTHTPGQPPAAQFSPEELERLRSLGYVR